MIDLNSSIFVTNTLSTTLQRCAYFQLVYVVSGRGCIVKNDNKMKIKENDYFIIEFEEPHMLLPDYSKDFNIIVLSFHPEFIDQSIYRAKSTNELANSYLIRFNYRIYKDKASRMIFHDIDGSIAHFFRSSLEEYKNVHSGFVQCIRCYVVLIILSIMRTLLSAEDCNLYRDFLKHINDVVDVNYMEPLKLSDFAKELNYSLSYLSRRFKQIANMSFIEYLQMKRIEQSCKLLEQADKKMSEIAYLVGYSDMKFFNRTFKKYMKMTPTEYKKIVKK